MINVLLGAIFVAGVIALLRPLPSDTRIASAIAPMERCASGVAGTAIPYIVRRFARTAPPATLPSKRSAVIRRRLAELADPGIARDLDAQALVRLLHAGLTTYDGDRPAVRADLARAWTRSRDGSVWTFHLNPSKVWSDGTPMTSYDVKRSWLSVIGRDTGVGQAHMMIIKGALAFSRGEAPASSVGIETHDARTVRVRLEHGVPWFDQTVALPGFAVARPTSDALAAVSGPFVVRVGEDGSLTFVPNVRHSGTTAHATFVILPQRHERFAIGVAFPSPPPVGPGFATSVQLPPEPFPTIDQRSVMLLWMNASSPGLTSAAVRRAIASLVDQSEVAVRGMSCVVTPQSTVGFDAGSSLLRRTTKDRLRRLGWRSSTVLTIGTRGKADDAQSRRVMRVVADQIGRGGVRVEMARSGEDADLVLSGWRAEYFDDYNLYDLLDCTSNYNQAHWCDSRYHRLLKRAVSTMDAARRRDIERTLERMLTGPHGSYPVVPLYRERTSVAVHGATVSPLGYVDLSTAVATTPSISPAAR